jgi:hypothetical protein
MPLPFDFDFKNPDYAAVFQHRMDVLGRIRANPDCLPTLKEYYRNNVADFIEDWGTTYEPRNVEIGLPTLLPFILFPKQREWIEWVIARWRAREPGLTEKSRDAGISWCAIGVSCTLCLFHDGMSVGFGSRKTEYVDDISSFKALLPKGRMFMQNLPEEFRGGWRSEIHSPFKKIMFPETGSLISGEGGDDVGRGDRTGLYFFDEAAHHPRAELVDASLSQTTNCRMDVSSVRGMNNPFAKKRWGGKISVFIIDWKDDPRKDDAWYQKQCNELDPIVVAQEIDRDYQASVAGVLIPAAWVRAAIDCKKKLGIAPSGSRGMSLDVADEGVDKNCACISHGTTVVRTVEWSGKGADIYATTERAFEIADEEGLPGFEYDADGIGASVRGDARVLNERRVAAGKRALRIVGYRGSDAVHDPEGIVDGTIGDTGDKGRRNEDYFANRKAQSWWAVRERFRKVYRWVEQGKACAADDIIEISSADPEYMKLVAEFSQPTFSTNGAGKIVIDKKPKKPGMATSMPSPNRADSVVIRFAPKDTQRVKVSGDVLAQIARAGRRR